MRIEQPIYLVFLHSLSWICTNYYDLCCQNKYSCLLNRDRPMSRFSQTICRWFGIGYEWFIDIYRFICRYIGYWPIYRYCRWNIPYIGIGIGSADIWAHISTRPRPTVLTNLGFGQFWQRIFELWTFFEPRLTSKMANRLKNTEPDYNDLRLFI